MSIEQRGYGIEECCVLGFESATAFQNLIACLVFVIHDKKYSRKAAQLLICSIKGKVKKKHFSRGWNFSTFAAHWIEQDLI
jgi:hypothetical protein